jgi:indolepyruvate ferredoxin oxidoreductase alpha subunit
MSPETIPGSQLLALGAMDAGVQFVTGYPGSPSTAVVEALLALGGDRVRIEWAINEKSAFDAAFGCSLAGIRSLVCLKSVGLNVALDSLMVSNLAAGDGGFVVLVGDDPGGWGSQNEQDSRPLVAAAEVPLLEPTSPADAAPVMLKAFELSEEHRVPVVVRITRALAGERVTADLEAPVVPAARPAAFQRQPERFNVLPIHVVEFHQRLQTTLDRVEEGFEASSFNGENGPPSRWGILAAGYTFHKMGQLLTQANAPPVRVLRLGTLHPLPERLIAKFAESLDSMLVLEETAPYVESHVQALAQRAGLDLAIHGRMSGCLPSAGELFTPELAQAFARWLPDWSQPDIPEEKRAMPSRQPLCDDCPYIPLFEALLGTVEQHGRRADFVITGETGCMVRAQLPPWQLLDLKYGMGSSIGLAAGLKRAGIPQRVIALSGDSALLHSGLGELIDAAQANLDLVVIVLANRTTALSGGQPHPSTAYDAYGRPRKAVDLAELARAAGVDLVRAIDATEPDATKAGLEEALAYRGLAVVIADGPCPR